MFSAILGLSAGLGHVFSGPDHLTAIAPIAMKNPRRSWIAGAQWGLGHSTGVFVVGLLSLLLRDMLPQELISSWSERLVGMLLIGIGIWGLRKAFSKQLHEHEHSHDGHTHLHVHFHPSSEKDHAATAHRHRHAAFGIGTLHGLAGSSHFLGVLPSLAMPTQLDAVIYLACFGLGTIVAMALFSTSIGLIARRAPSLRVYRGLMGVSSIAALVVGVCWLAFGGW